MLCQFSFQNFKSYRGETTFDLQASAIPEFADSLITRERCSSLLPVSVVYGPNGGGKTNLLQALSCLISTVVKPIHDLEKNRKSLIMQQRIQAEPFLFDSVSEEEPTEFRIFFRTNEPGQRASHSTCPCKTDESRPVMYEYRYYLAVLKGEIFAETLDRKKIGGKKPARIFYREGGEISLGTILKKENVSTSVNAKMPFLSFLAINYNIPAVAEVQEWFESCIIRSYANPMAEMRIMVSDDAAFKKQIVLLLNDMGIEVDDYRFDDQEKQLYLTRRIEDTEYELAFDHESDGTRKLIAALPVLLTALQEGRLVIIDELDAKLHPKLLRYVISMFKNQGINAHGAQLLFTSHDMATMKNTVFRRDEIWFAALNERYGSELYSLYEIRREDHERINSTAAFDKQYMEGRYGADPYLQNMMSESEWRTDTSRLTRERK
ncbi:AAA family ATPase [Schaedlerella arabinosiphila]|uniref:AAA family ATPase n=1 Tax=Schaedlerella arabinosiphila TaxID=2044587 RepID=UPI002557DB1E|nr:ATP-binding protein [Schaedlerella arabinosiphila]